MPDIDSAITTDAIAFETMVGEGYKLLLGNYLISSNNDGLKLDGTQQEYDLIVSGLIRGRLTDSYAGVVVAESNFATISIDRSGSTAGSVGIAIYGQGDIHNAGSIVAFQYSAVWIIGAGAVTCENTGSILGTVGVNFESQAEGEHTIDNLGLISGTDYSVVSADGLVSKETVTNSGTIIGDMYLAGGDDTVDTKGGNINGIVDLGDGANKFIGSHHFEHVIGGSGSDRLTSNGGGDTLEGGGSSDVYYVDEGDTVVETVGGGDNDVVYVKTNYALGASEYVETLSAKSGINVQLIGNSVCATTIVGSSGYDDIISWDDDLFVDVLAGGKGNDTYWLGSAHGDTIDDKGGWDAVFSDISRNLNDYVGVEDLLLQGSKKANATGNHASNYLSGNNLANTLSGLGGADSLSGNGGKDMMRGGLGQDLFYYYLLDDSGITAASRDVIIDFQHGADIIEVHYVDAVSGGDDDEFSLHSRGRASDAVGGGEICYYWIDKAGKADDQTILRFGTDADSAAEMTVALSGLHTMTEQDFIL